MEYYCVKSNDGDYERCLRRAVMTTARATPEPLPEPEVTPEPPPATPDPDSSVCLLCEEKKQPKTRTRPKHDELDGWFEYVGGWCLSLGESCWSAVSRWMKREAPDDGSCKHTPLEKFFTSLRLDDEFSLLRAQKVQKLWHLFQEIDINKDSALDETQFCVLMRLVQEWSLIRGRDIRRIFKILDLNEDGTVDFPEFYLLICIILARKTHDTKRSFLYRHSRLIFNLLDKDSSQLITPEEFRCFGLLFDFPQKVVERIFKEFDISGDFNLDYEEFEIFASACIDEVNELRKKKEEAKKTSLRQNLKELILGDAA